MCKSVALASVRSPSLRVRVRARDEPARTKGRPVFEDPLIEEGARRQPAPVEGTVTTQPNEQEQDRQPDLEPDATEDVAGGAPRRPEPEVGLPSTPEVRITTPVPATPRPKRIDPSETD